jgi:hypothetical protein
VESFGRGGRRAVAANNVDLYKFVFSPSLPPTLAHVGLFQVLRSLHLCIPPT